MGVKLEVFRVSELCSGWTVGLLRALRRRLWKGGDSGEEGNVGREFLSFERDL